MARTRKKREFTVVCHYPTEENMEEFQNRFHNAVAIALQNSHTKEWMEAFKRELDRQIKEDEELERQRKEESLS